MYFDFDHLKHISISEPEESQFGDWDSVPGTGSQAPELIGRITTNCALYRRFLGLEPVTALPAASLVSYGFVVVQLFILYI
jgi:hypothetical protein